MSLFGLRFGGVQIGILLLFLNIFISFIDAKQVNLKIHAMDLSYSIWFVSLIPSFIIFLNNSNISFFEKLDNELGLLTVFVYLLFRIAWVKDFKIDTIIILLLKISCIWIIIEFFIINIFDLYMVVENILNPIFKSNRIYDGFVGGYIKASGPIPGSQNGSIIAAIACMVFLYLLDIFDKNHYKKWIFFAILAFLFTFTLTGLLVLLFLALFKYRVNFFFFALIGILGTWLGYSTGFIALILKLKNGSDMDPSTLLLIYLDLFGVNDFSKSLDLFASNPFGLGWFLENNFIDNNDNGFNQEIYLFRIILLGGWLVFFSIIGLTTLNAIIYLYRHPIILEYKISYHVAHVYVCAFLISTIHYASLSFLPIAFIFSAMCVQLVYTSKRNFIKRIQV
jgi:hypothetical protein